MLGATPIAAVLGAVPSNTAPTAELKMFVRAAADIGLALMYCAPGSKEPADLRSSVAKRADDKAAQEAAKDAGRADWARVKSHSGLYLATTDTKLLCRYLDAYRKRYGEDCPVNFGIEVGRSRRIIVDCDTTEQREAFLRDAGITDPVPPTVSSPGARDAEGNWVHYDGGHYYFTLPDGYELPQNVGMWTSPSGYAVLWRDRYVLIPPSTRTEGAYTQTSHEFPAPDWLLDKITAHAATRIPRSPSDADGELATVVDAWAESVTWADLLGPLGWSLANRYDNCGCDVWTAPGPHDSPKSATTHDGGCGLGRYTEVNAPMHIWTHNPGEPFEAWIADKGTTTLTKLQVYALAEHKGNIGDAMAALGLTDSLGDSTALEFGLDTAGLNDPNAFEAALKAGPAKAEPELTHAEIDADHERHDYSFDDDGGPVTTGATPVDPSTSAPESPHCADGTCTQCPMCIVLEQQAPGCAHQDVTVAGRCTSCGAQVRECQHPNTIDLIHCAVCGVEAFGKLKNDADVIDLPTPDPQAGDDLVENDTPADVIDLPTPTADAFGFDYAPGDAGPAPDSPPSAAPTEFPNQAGPAAELEDPAIFTPPEGSNLPRIMPFKHWRGYPKPEYTVEGLIEQGGLSTIFGPSGVGKSVVIIDMLCHIATGRRWHGRKTIQQKVMYMPGEGVGGASNRIETWEKAHGRDVSESVLMAEDVVPAAASTDDWALFARYVIEQGIGLIVFDTFARMAVGIDENSAKEVGAVVKRLDQVRKHTGAGVLIIHHSAKGTVEARGSSALKGAMDSELIVLPVDPRSVDLPDGEGYTPIQVQISKQKNASAALEPMPFLLTPYDDSVILTGPSGKIGDPMDQFVTVRTMAEPVIETAIRIQEFAQRFTEQGVTRMDAFVGVPMDDYHRTTKNPDRMWKLRVSEAIDLGLRFGLFETLSGTASGSRYLATSIGREYARKLADEEAVSGDSAAGGAP